LVANEKGGRHVAATMMVIGQDNVDVFVARNDKFRQSDVTFLEQTEALLRLIARGMAFRRAYLETFKVSRLTKTPCPGSKTGIVLCYGKCSLSATR
jgi:hypothetical protein